VKVTDTLPPLSPAFFFTVRCDVAHIKEKKDIERRQFKLPYYPWLLDEQVFADVYMGWYAQGHAQGVVLAFDIHVAFEEARYPQFEDGDSIEIFIDTRDMKQATYAHRFCHHFLLLPVEVQGVRALEITRLRADDKRPLCDPDDIGIDVSFGKKNYTVKVDLPASCLYGFDPAVCDHLGFAYRINRATGPAQHFSISSQSCQIAQYPALWASMPLKS